MLDATILGRKKLKLPEHRTLAAQMFSKTEARTALPDHLVGGGEQPRWHREAERLEGPTGCAFQYRESAAAGGLMSYGGNAMDAFRLVGAYTGRILKGQKPSDLPVQ